MGTIKNFIENIKKARYGKDVRQSIVDALEQTYDDAIANGHTDMEVVKARDKYDNLNSRLEADKTERIESINKEAENRKNADANLQSQINGLASGSPLIASSIAEMTDTSRVYVNTADGNWYYYNDTEWISGGKYQSTGLGTESVRAQNLSNDLKAINEIEILNLIYNDGEYIKSDGNIVNQNGWCYSEPFLLRKGQTLCFDGTGYKKHVSYVSICDEDKNNIIPVLISNADEDYEFKEIYYTTNVDKYIMISGKKPNYVYIYKAKNENYLNIQDSQTIIDNASRSSYIRYMDGNSDTYQNTQLSASDYIEVTSKRYFKMFTYRNEDISAHEDKRGLAFYDNNKNFISSIRYTINTKYIEGIIPDSAKYMRITISENMLKYGFELVYDLKKILDDYDKSNKKIESEIEKLNHINYASFSSFIKFGVIGDSLASGECVANQNGESIYIDNYDYSWGQFIARKHGMTCVNFSKGGLTTRSWLTDINGLSKLKQSYNLCNAYIIGLGVNDYTKLGVDYLGTIEDIKEDYIQNADTFYGNYGKIIANIFNIASKSKIFALTIPVDDAVAVQYNNAIREIASYFENVYVIDLYTDNLSDFTEGFINNNRRKGHYNSIAYNYMSKLLFDKISKFMSDNYEEFKQIEFINTDYKY